MATIAVIIPALNEGGNIRQLVEEIRSTISGEVIVVDNDSTDDTAQQAALAGARVISELCQGYGFACAAGVAAVPDTDILIFMDGDGSFLPAELPLILNPLLEGQADLVLGSRVLGHIAPGAMPPHQRFGNWLTSRLMNAIYGLSITDLGPYRAIRGKLLSQLDMREMTYGWPTEMIVKAAQQERTIIEVPVSYLSRRSGRSKVSGTLRGTFLAAWFILGVTLRYALKRNDNQKL
jgi:glycosyltransferase involved in cell wall biosynthesis